MVGKANSTKSSWKLVSFNGAQTIAVCSLYGSQRRFEGIATKAFGEPKKPLLAKRGDAVSFKNNGEIILGICVGDKIAAVSEAGLINISMREAINAWSI